jgi:hypothetical protein
MMTSFGKDGFIIVTYDQQIPALPKSGDFYIRSNGQTFVSDLFLSCELSS